MAAPKRLTVATFVHLGVYAIEAQRTIDDLADSWNPYLTIREAIHLAALSFTRDPSKRSCCAA